LLSQNPNHGHPFCNDTDKQTHGKRILGIILAIIGAIGLILAAVGFANGGFSGRGIRMIVIYSILGAIFFFAGISLVKNTRDKAT
jgi:hypothetical protein